MADTQNLAKCSDGYDRHHHFVTQKGEYSFWSWVWLFAGVSIKPRKVLFTCSVCKETFDETEDPELLAKYY